MTGDQILQLGAFAAAVFLAGCAFAIATGSLIPEVGVGDIILRGMLLWPFWRAIGRG